MSAAAVESDIQIPGDQTGPAVRTVTVTTLIDGTSTDVQMEVVALSDGNGSLLDTSGWQREVLGELRALVTELGKLRSAFQSWSGVQAFDHDQEGTR